MTAAEIETSKQEKIYEIVKNWLLFKTMGNFGIKINSLLFIQFVKIVDF